MDVWLSSKEEQHRPCHLAPLIVVWRLGALRHRGRADFGGFCASPWKIPRRICGNGTKRIRMMGCGLARLVPRPVQCVTARFNALEVNPMFASRLLFCVAALALAAPSFASTTRPVMTPTEMREHRAVSNFLNAVDHYVVVHHRVTRAIEPGMMCLPDHTIAEINELADTSLDARPMPQEGDIFAPDVAEIFRDRIGAALRHQGINVWDLVAEMNEDELVAPPVIVA
jgi:hypothetical protein